MGSTHLDYGSARSNPRNLILGLLIGGLIGATALLFFAPQSGKQTRDQIQRRSVEWRGRTTDVGKRALAQIESLPTKLRHVIGQTGE
jgi:gas vesicle protein